MQPEVIFLDAAGTLIQVREPVGATYARIAAPFGVRVEPAAIMAAFRSSWKALPPPIHEQPPDDDDRSWWRALVDRTFETATGSRLALGVMDPLFETLYQHFAQPEAWTVYKDVVPALDRLQGRARLWVLSNFDRRLRTILEGHGLAQRFEGMIISSEVGVSKPHPRIFLTAMAKAGVEAQHCLHVGDDEKADIGGATHMGIPCHLVQRPGADLLDLAEKLFSH